MKDFNWSNLGLFLAALFTILFPALFVMALPILFIGWIIYILAKD